MVCQSEDGHHPATNQARRWVTSLIRTITLHYARRPAPVRQTELVIWPASSCSRSLARSTRLSRKPCNRALMNARTLALCLAVSADVISAVTTLSQCERAVTLYRNIHVFVSQCERPTRLNRIEQQASHCRYTRLMALCRCEWQCYGSFFPRSDTFSYSQSSRRWYSICFLKMFF